MSKTSEKVSWASRRFSIGLFALFSALSVRASVDQPDATKLFGNAYHDGGWFSCGTKQHSNGYLLFDIRDEFVLSPRYSAPVRKIVLNVRCTSESPTKHLLLCPFVDGVEAADRVVTNSTVAVKDTNEIVTADFSLADNVDAFRLLLGGGGSTGNWGVDAIVVFYGEKTDDEDAILRQFAQQLPLPEDLRLTGLASSSLEVSASPVESAVGYCFELTKLTGCPRTELREDFTAAPNLSNGWTCDVQTEGLTLSDGGKTYSDSAAGDERALKIEKATNPKEGPVELGLVSPLSSEPITGWSFVMRIGGTGKSNRVVVQGRTSEDSTWISLADGLTPEKQGSNTRFEGAVERAQDIRQVRFVLTANADSWTTTGLDSLCVVYGGDEARELVSAQTNAVPEAVWQELASGRYGCRVKALGEREGEEQFKDSTWSDELTADLAWADVKLSPPENLTYEVFGEQLNLSWSPVAMADHYEVKVALVDDPENPVATLVAKGASASVPLAELGDYVVTVTAVSPGGVSTASALLENCTVALGKVTGLAVEATAADTIAATWKAVPLAESYQAKLFKVTGEAGTEISDYSKLQEGVWPDGWDCSSDWMTNNLTTTGPKFTYSGEWIETKFLSVGITRVTYVFKSNSSAAGKLGNQHLQVEAYSEKDGEWSVCTDVDVVSTSQATEELSFEISDDVRRLRFTALTRNGNYAPAIQLGKVSVSYGEYVRTEVESVGTKDCAATYRGLDRTAKYVVVVTPQPSEGTECEASSVIVDLASEYFRPVGPVSIAGCKGVYLQRFDALAAVTKETDLRRVPIENWQFFKGSGEAEKMFYTSGTNSTKGGAYCYSDAERTTNSFMIGTVATSSMGSSVGLAFVNDTGSALGAPTLTFTATRRNEKPGDPYQLEWLVTDGPWSIGTESDSWTPLPLTEGEPGFSVAPDDCKLAPGQVIIFRWRQEKVSGGPMLGLDDVHVEFPVDKPGFMLHLR